LRQIELSWPSRDYIFVALNDQPSFSTESVAPRPVEIRPKPASRSPHRVVQ